MADMFKVGCPFGLFHLDGRWEPNYRLSLTAAEQQAHNESVGVFPFAKQSPSWLAEMMQKGLVKSA